MYEVDESEPRSRRQEGQRQRRRGIADGPLLGDLAEFVLGLLAAFVPLLAAGLQLGKALLDRFNEISDRFPEFAAEAIARARPDLSARERALQQLRQGSR